MSQGPCSERGPEGYVCTEPEGHLLDHIARAARANPDGDGHLVEIVETWPRTDLVSMLIGLREIVNDTCP